MTTYTLTDLQYSESREGPFVIYIYGDDGHHDGGTWANRTPKIEGEITCRDMMHRALHAAALGREVRIVDRGDMLVYHCKGTNLIYPRPIGKFWSEICG